MHSLKNIHGIKSNKLKALLFIATFLILSSGTLQAETYYVAPGGSASWSQCMDIGTPCSPATAMRNAIAGDTTYFRGGTYSITGGRTAYHGLLEPSNSGTQSSPIIFMAYNDEIPVISVNCTTSENQCWSIGTNAKDYITWDGFILRTSNNKTAGIFIGGESYSTGAVFKNSTVIAGSLPVSDGDNFDITRMEKTSYATYTNNRIGGLRSPSPSDNNAALKMYDNDHSTIEYNEFFDSPMGISAKRNMDYAIIRHNYFHDNHEDIHNNVYLSSDSDYNKIYQNLFSNTGYLGINITQSEAALARGWEIYNNTFYMTSGLKSVWLGASSELSFYNNILAGPNQSQFTTVRNSSTLTAMDHNQYGTSSLSIELRRYDSSSEYTPLSSWKSSGELISGGNPGAGSLTSDPLFVNGSGSMSQISDFELSPSSPSKGAGRNGVDMGANANLVGYSGSAPPRAPSIILSSN